MSCERGKGVTFINMDQSAEGGLHKDLLKHHPWNGEKAPIISSGGFEPMMQEVINLEA